MLCNRSFIYFFGSLPFPLLAVRHIFEISEVHPWAKVMRPQSLMNFALRCVRIFPGVNSRAELVTLAPGTALRAVGSGIKWRFLESYWLRPSSINLQITSFWSINHTIDQPIKANHICAQFSQPISSRSSHLTSRSTLKMQESPFCAFFLLITKFVIVDSTVGTLFKYSQCQLLMPKFSLLN